MSFENYITESIQCKNCGDRIGSVSGYESGVKKAIEHRKGELCSYCQTGQIKVNEKVSEPNTGWEF